MKTSKRRQRASKANAAKSTGPKTSEGKARSSHSAVRHGLLARCVVLECEDRKTFEQLLEHFVQRFDPLDDVEFGMIEEMASCQWRMRRGWVAETQIMNKAVRKHADTLGRNAEICIAASIGDSDVADKIALLNRYEGRLSRMYQRALRNLLQLREQKAASARSAAANAVENVVAKEEENESETLEVENGETKLIPKLDTRPDASATGSSPIENAPPRSPRALPPLHDYSRGPSALY
jgi:hypothetical protein